MTFGYENKLTSPTLHQCVGYLGVGVAPQQQTSNFLGYRNDHTFPAVKKAR